MKTWQKDFLYCVLLALLVLTFLNRGVRMQGLFFGADEIATDLLHFSYPYREFWATDYLKKGNIALWNPYIGSGLPMLAEAQTGMFYPVAMILYYFLPPAVAFNYLIISAYIFIALGTYAYVRKLGLQPFAAFFAASVFTLSGFMVVRLRHVPIITAAAVMPLMFLATEYLLTGAKALWALILGIFIAISFFSGHLTTTYLIIFMLFVYFFLRAWAMYKDPTEERLRPIILFIGAMILGICLSAIQLIPSVELMQYSTRVGIPQSVEHVWDSSFQWKYLLFFLNPYLLGDPSRGTWMMDKENYWENMGYLGIIPLALVIIAFFRWYKNKRSIGLAISLMFLFGLVLTLGDLTPIYQKFIDWVPGFSLTRIPGRFLLFVDFFGAIMAGFGLQTISAWFTGRKKTIIVFLVFFFGIADLFYFGYPFNTVMPLQYLSPPQSVQFLKKDPDLFRVRSVGEISWIDAWQKLHGWRGDLSAYIAQREVIPPDLNILFRLSAPSIIYELGGHFSVRRPGELDSLIRDSMGKEKSDHFAKLLGMENVKYLIGTNDMSNIPGITLVSRFDTEPKGFTIFIYRNDQVLPRAYVVGKSKSFSNEVDLAKALFLKDFHPAEEVYLNESDNFNETSPQAIVTMEEYRDIRVAIRTTLKEDGFLVLSDTFYPGWKATIDGRETKIYQANYAYRAVRVEKGNHQIIFTYDPMSVKAGALVSAGSLIAFSIIAGISFVKHL